MNRPIMHIMSPPGIIFVFVPMQSQKITSSVLFLKERAHRTCDAALWGGVGSREIVRMSGRDCIVAAIGENVEIISILDNKE